MAHRFLVDLNAGAPGGVAACAGLRTELAQVARSLQADITLAEEGFVNENAKGS